MAIFPTLNNQHPSPINHNPNPTLSTEHVIEALQGVTISQPTSVPTTAPRPSVTLSIPLDAGLATQDQDRANTYRRRREPHRRDSLKRREALLKGKEGSRRRQRWENDRLLNNPHAQPPLPSDWEVHPTYPRLSTVPYYLAPLWDGELGRKATLAKEKRAKKSGLEKEASEKVAKELKETLKRARAARGLLQDLETEVRSFVERWSEAEQREATSEQSDGDSEDEEIVFVGRNGQTKKGKGHDRGGRSRREEREMDKLIFESLVDDHGARFGRWLVHSIGTYYGLRTWSITVGDPARREAYVSIGGPTGDSPLPMPGQLPRPLWGMV